MSPAASSARLPSLPETGLPPPAQRPFRDEAPLIVERLDLSRTRFFPDRPQALIDEAGRLWPPSHPVFFGFKMRYY